MLSLYLRIGILLSSLVYLPATIDDFRERETWRHYLLIPYAVYPLAFFVESRFLFIKGLVATVVALVVFFTFYKVKKNWIGRGDAIGLPAMFAQMFDMRLVLIYYVVIAGADVLYNTFKVGGVLVEKSRIPESELFKWVEFKDGKMTYGAPAVGYVYLACFLASITYAVFFA